MTREKISYFDAHCDTAARLWSSGYRENLWENSFHVDLSRGVKYEKRAQIYAIFANSAKCENVETRYHEIRDAFLTELKKQEKHVSLCRNADEAETAFSEGKQAAFLSVEGAELLGCRVDALEEVYELGIRAVNITWNHANLLSGSNVENINDGLSSEGIDFVRACGRLGVAVDVSHISDAGFRDVLRYASGPVIASHSNARALCPHPRNLTDDMFRELCAYGGVAGLNLYPLFLGEKADIDTAVRHLEHFLALGGEKHLGLGCDLDGIDSMPAGIGGVQDLDKLYVRLAELGYPHSLLNDIFFGNFMRIFA